MPMQWLMIFFVLENFLLSGSDGSPVNFTEDEQRAKDDDVNYPNEGFNSSSEASDSEVSIKTRKISITCLNQETTDHRHDENEKLSSEKNYQHLITALSKIAKVRSSEKDPGRCSMANVYSAAQNKSTYLQRRISEKITRGPIPFDKKLSSNLFESLFNNVSNGGIRQGNLPCHAIEDIYISEIKEKVPSYRCTFGNITFILSSKRFFQDRRSSLCINIDNDILRKLNSSTTNSTNNQFNIIPAVLVLKPFHENYDLHNPQNF